MAAVSPRRAGVPGPGRMNKYHEIGVRGRKTGLEVKSVSRDDEGMEDMDEFFKSPAESTRKASATSTTGGRSGTAKRLAQRDENHDPRKSISARQRVPSASEIEPANRTVRARKVTTESLPPPPLPADDFDMDMDLGTSFDPSPTPSPQAIKKRLTFGASARNVIEERSSPEPETEKVPLFASRRRTIQDEEPVVVGRKKTGLTQKQTSGPFELATAFGDEDLDQGGDPGVPSDDEQPDVKNDDDALTPRPRGRIHHNRSPPTDSASDAPGGQRMPKQRRRPEVKSPRARTDRARKEQSVDTESGAPSRRKREEAAQPVRQTLPKIEDEVYEDEMEGKRRSRRAKMAPLAFWRGEKVVYGRRESGVAVVPVVKEIIRVPSNTPEGYPYAKKPQRRGHQRADSASYARRSVNREEGWDQATDPVATIIDYETQEELERRVAFTADMVHFDKKSGAKFKFQKAFSDSDYFAGGLIYLPVGGCKPSKPSRDNAYIIYCIEGAVRVTLHQTQFVIATGGMFLIPRGNYYGIENIADRETKLFFSQARRIEEEGSVEAEEGRTERAL